MTREKKLLRDAPPGEVDRSSKKHHPVVLYQLFYYSFTSGECNHFVRAPERTIAKVPHTLDRTPYSLLVASGISNKILPTRKHSAIQEQVNTKAQTPFPTAT
ncbi:hypothetical protein AFLA_001971 [Aspergillus flavus NRRL3357]|nr:hypothetical protein AFLA_001971 [Aspergillus flavus NRRL3357]